MLIRQCLNILLCKNVVLNANSSLCLWNIIIAYSCQPCILNNSSSATFIHSSTSCCSSFILSLLFFVEIVEIVKHQIHIFLLFTLKVMNNSMIFMDFDSYMSISLSRYCSRLDELTLLMIIYIIVPLSSLNIYNFIVHQTFIVI